MSATDRGHQTHLFARQLLDATGCLSFGALSRSGTANPPQREPTPRTRRSHHCFEFCDRKHMDILGPHSYAYTLKPLSAAVKPTDRRRC